MPDGHIQKHLHSMFQLLRSEETLKMAVKLESGRIGRTRYLVVVSCRRKPTQRELSTHFNQQLINAQNNNNSTSSNNTSHSVNHMNAINNNRKSASFGGQQSAIQSLISSPSVGLSSSVTMATSAMSTSATTTPTHSISSMPSTNNLSSAYMKTNILINERDVNSSKRSNQNQQQEQTNQTESDYEIEESCLLGIDCNEKTTVGLVVRILGDTTIRLDGDGGFSVSGSARTHIFKPASVQAMWSALQTLHKACAKAREHKFYPGGPSHEWVSHYFDRIHSDRSCLNEWNAMDSIESRRAPSPDAIRNKPTAREETERIIRTALKEIILQLDLDEVTSKYIRTRLEEHLDMNLTEYKSFIDQEMLTILGQLDAPTKIFDHVYLGSEWNASNLEELQRNGVRHILNVTREIDNFFPGMFDYFNVRVYDDEKTNLLKHWDNTFKYITQAKNDGSKVLVHCKMGVSRSASVVIAYAMKAYGLSYREAFEHVKQNRSCVKPNKNFVSQLETYQGMLAAMKNKEKLQRSKSDTNLRSTKDARLLPGSEPTPLIQALDAAAKKEEEESNRFQSRAVASSNRPKSWSPDSVEAAILLPKQLSQSMENLPPERVESDDWEAKNNVRLPCKNGQNYSVSQNQVFHLDAHKSSVKLIVNELESHQKRLKEAKAKQANSREDNWDPGDKISPETIRRNLAPTGQLSSTVPNVCDKNFNTGSGPVTKALSHDSPFGSLRRSESIKARISSDASPVMKSRSLDANTSTKLNKSPVFRHSAPEDARPVPFPGWTRRCASFNTSPNQQTIVSRSASSLSNSSSSSTVSLSGGGVNNPTNQSPSDLINNLGPKNVKNLCNSFAMREKHAQKGTGGGASERQVPEIRIDASKRNSDSSFVNMAIARFADQFSKDFMQCIKKRCKSDETLYESADIMSTVNKRLSASSPSDYSPTHFNDKTPFLSRPTFIWSSHRASPIAKNVANAAKARRAKSRATCRTVENLKLNFESRESDGSDAKDVKRGRSLPSSPSASIYVNTANVNTSDPTSKLNCDKIGYEEINVKGLVDRYEVTKLKNDQTSPLFNNFSAQLKRTQQKFAAAAAGDNSRTNIVHPKPPPIPHTANVQTKPANNILLAKRMQHENQSFANIRQHFNSPSAYNTM